jgi:hypothetical protein
LCKSNHPDQYAALAQLAEALVLGTRGSRFDSEGRHQLRLRLVVGYLTLNQETVVRPHEPEPRGRSPKVEAASLNLAKRRFDSDRPHHHLAPLPLHHYSPEHDRPPAHPTRPQQRGGTGGYRPGPKRGVGQGLRLGARRVRPRLGARRPALPRGQGRADGRPEQCAAMEPMIPRARFPIFRISNKSLGANNNVGEAQGSTNGPEPVPRSSPEAAYYGM